MSGYYEWRKRLVNKHQQEDCQLADCIEAAYHANWQVYGNPRLSAELQAQGIKCSRKRIARLMRALGLCARRPHHRDHHQK